MNTLKTLLILCITLFSFLSFTNVNAWFFDEFLNGSETKVQYCDDEWECWLEQGIEIVRDWINDIETERTFSEYIQDIVIYLLSFITIIAVIYIIYAGFRLIVDTWDDGEKTKNAKSTILYVIIWIVIIWLAFPITKWLMAVLNTPGAQ